MAESEEHARIHRFVSGELSAQESKEFMRRLLRDPELRKTVEEFQRADDAALECFLDDIPEAAELDEGQLPASRRRVLIHEILSRTTGPVVGSRPQQHRPHKAKPFWRRLAPTLAAAAALAVLGLLVAVKLPPRSGGPARPQFSGPIPIDQERVERLKVFKKALGSNVAVISPAAQSGGEFVPIDAKDAKDVVLRVTVVRIAGDESKPWAVDALIPRGQVVELVTDTRAGWCPESVKVSVAASNGGHVPVTIQARLSADAQVTQTVKVDLSQPERVAEVNVGEVRFEIYLQAELQAAAGQIL